MNQTPHIKLSELTYNIEQVISKAFAEKSYWVLAETSAVKYYQQKNYFFFDLVEKEPTSNVILTTIKSSAFGTSVTKIRNFERATGQKFDSNIQVLLKVGVEYTVKWGLKLNFLEIDHSYTIGNLEMQRQETLKRLIVENPQHVQIIGGEYITFNKKLSINPVIQKIALISSPNAEGYRDFLKILLENQFKYLFNIDEYLTLVQGESASQLLVQKLIEVFNSKKDYDAVVIVRGGGAPTDFIVFDSYNLSRAVARFPIPIITGIGHTANLSIVDKMAFKATIAPTKAAESIIAHNRLFEERVLGLQEYIASSVSQLISHHQLNLNRINSILISKSKDILSENAQELAHINTKLLTKANDFIIHRKQQLIPFLHSIVQKATNLINSNHFLIEKHTYTIQKTSTKFLSERQYRLNYYIQLVKHLSPINVLKRGYALLYQNGNIVTNPENLKKGDEIITLLSDTEINSTINSKKKNDEPRFKL